MKKKTIACEPSGTVVIRFKTMKEFDAYAVGVCYASVCTSLPLEEATIRLNREHPTGLDHPWVPSKNETFHSGWPNPCPCHDHPETHKHYLFSC